MNLSTAIINGTLKLIYKLSYGKGTKKENVMRVYNPQDPRVPEEVLFESKTNPGTYLNESTNTLYFEQSAGRFIGV